MSSNPIKHGELIIYSIILLLPTYLLRFNVGPIPINALDVIVVCGFSVWLLQQRSLAHLKQWRWIMGSFLLIGALACWVATDTIQALGLYKSYIIVPMLFAIMVLQVKPPLQRVVNSLSIVALFISSIGLMQYLSHYGIPAPWDFVTGNDIRITSVYAYPNAVGLFIAPIAAIIFAWIIHYPQLHLKKRLGYFFIFLSCLLTLILAKTDGALMALAGAMLVTLLYTRWRWWVVGLSAVIVIGLLAWSPTREVILLQDTSGQVRLALWQGTWNLLQHHPITGAGLGGFPELYARYKLDQHVELLLYPHNLLLDFWVELGLAGLVWLVVIGVRFFIQLARSRSRLQVVVLAGMVSVIVYGLVDVPYFKNDLAILFWLLLVMADTISNTK